MPAIAVCLIVRDAADVLDACLASVRALADEMVVCDTGSTDGTEAIAAGYATTLFTDPWLDDFGHARNTALDRCTADWVLSVDADEVAELDIPALRRALAELPDGIDALTVEIVNAAGSGSDAQNRHRENKLFRRDRLRWHGRVHERLLLADGLAPNVADLPPELIQLRHSGYDDPAVALAKATRNARLGELELLDPHSANDAARLQLDLGRSYYGQRLWDAAETALNTARALTPAGPIWLWATDFLVRVELGRGEPNAALGYLAELDAAGVPRSYHRWQQALALIVRGDLAHAASILESLDEVMDVVGTRLDPLDLIELRAALSTGLATLTA